jgi:sortase A
MQATPQIINTDELEQQIEAIQREIAHLQVRRRELSQRINKARKKQQRANNSVAASEAYAFASERDKIDEQLALLREMTQSFQQKIDTAQLGSYAAEYSDTQTETPLATPSKSRVKRPRWWHTLSKKTRSEIIWTSGNVLMLLGVVLLLYVGGLYANASYARYAARGDTDVPAPLTTIDPVVAYEPAPFIAPNLTLNLGGSNDGLVRSSIPDADRQAHLSTVSRIVIPSIDVDSKVVEVGWDVVEQGGQQVAIWQVAEYAVGQHRGSANPGEHDNIVLAGHVGGYGKVFKDLYYVQPGDQITLYSKGQQYLYKVSEWHLLDEEGVPAEQQAENAKFIAPTDYEAVTLVTCWPMSGPDKFKQRVVIRAIPFESTFNPDSDQHRWSIR